MPYRAIKTNLHGHDIFLIESANAWRVWIGFICIKVASSCVHGNEPSFTIKVEEFRDQLRE